jgi:hypothetical protein
MNNEFIDFLLNVDYAKIHQEPLASCSKHVVNLMQRKIKKIL